MPLARRIEVMAVTSKSPRAVTLAALAVARRSLPSFSHKNSPKTFTQHQLFACLVLKNFLKTDYRGVVAHLVDNPSLVGTLELGRVPHFTTLQKASHRLLAAAKVERLLDASVRLRMRRKRRVPSSAIDSTGLETSCASGYFVAAAQKHDKPAEKGGLPSLSEAGCGGQHERSFHSCAARRPGTAARRRRISAAGRTGSTTRSLVPDGGRCRLRLRSRIIVSPARTAVSARSFPRGTAVPPSSRPKAATDD